MKIGAFLKARVEHLRNARLSPAEIKALQLKKFRRLVAYANDHSPYYRDLIADRHIDIESCVPSDFPPLTKSDLMANFDRIVTDRRITAAGIEKFLLASQIPRIVSLMSSLSFTHRGHRAVSAISSTRRPIGQGARRSRCAPGPSRCVGDGWPSMV